MRANTPSSQLASQQNIAFRVAGKGEQSSPFRNVTIYLAVCNMKENSLSICRREFSLLLGLTTAERESDNGED